MLLGVDIGGTTIGLGLVDGYKVIRKDSVVSFAKDATLEDTIAYLKSIIEGFITPEVKRIGVGVPTLVDSSEGIVFDATNIPSWREVPLKKILETHFNLPVSVNNDSNCFALGAAAEISDPSGIVVGITLGTGIGVGVISEGKLFSGKTCGAGEIGALPYCGKDYEEFCSSKFFANKGLTGAQVAEAAAEGDENATAVFAEFGTHLGTFLSVVMFAYDPDCIIIGGGLSRSFDLFRESMMAALEKNYPYTRSLNRLKVMAMPQEGVALLGASLL